MRVLFCAVTAMLLGLHAGSATAETGGKLDRSHLVETFEDTFSDSLDLYDTKDHPHGRWKTNYDFGAQEGASSRTLPGEWQAYVDAAYADIDPFSIGDGVLTITARRNPRPSDPKLGEKSYTSGLLTTSQSFSQRYGYFEMRASLPVVPGAWPAFWLATPIDPTITTPQYGDEIDAMEFLGQDVSRIYCSVHWPDDKAGTRFKTLAVPITDPKAFHVYGVLWTQEMVTWYIDDVEVAHLPSPGFHRPMNILVDLAVGGWDRNVPPPDLPPMQMQVDFVRAYRVE